VAVMSSNPISGSLQRFADFAAKWMFPLNGWELSGPAQP